MTKPSAWVFLPDQLRQIADILDGLNRAESDHLLDTDFDGVTSVNLAARIPLEIDGDTVGWAVDDIGNCYMFEARVSEVPA